MGVDILSNTELKFWSYILEVVYNGDILFYGKKSYRMI